MNQDLINKKILNHLTLYKQTFIDIESLLESQSEQLLLVTEKLEKIKLKLMEHENRLSFLEK